MNDEDRTRIRDLAHKILKIVGTAQDDVPTPNNAIPTGAWRDDSASEKQLTLMEKHGLRSWPGITKGDASDAIDYFFKSKKGEKS